MASIPFFLEFHLVIAAGGGVITASYNVPAIQTLHVNKWIYTSTGVWGIYQIRNANGRVYGNLSQSNPFRSDFIQKGASPNIGILDLPYELLITGGDTLYIDIIDTSGAANTIELGLCGVLDLGG